MLLPQLLSLHSSGKKKKICLFGKDQLIAANQMGKHSRCECEITIISEYTVTIILKTHISQDYSVNIFMTRQATQKALQIHFYLYMTENFKEHNKPT